MNSKRELVNKFESDITSLDGVSSTKHQMGGREFLWNGKEIGYIHYNGVLDILFNKKIRDLLLKDNLVQEHRWVPNSGWTTFYLNNESDLSRAEELIRLSLAFHLKRKAPNNFENEMLERLNFPDRVKSLIKN